MIIDCNAHLGYWPFRELNNSQPAEFVSLMDRCGLTQATVAAFQGVLYSDLQPANYWLIEAISEHSQRLVPHAVINPNFPEWESDLQCAVEAGCAGVRLYPNYHSYDVSDECVGELMAAADECGVTVSVYVRMYDERLHHPRCMVPPVDLSALPELAEQFPDVGILVCNAKNAAISGIAEGLRELPNLYVEISHVEGPGGVEKLAAEIGAESIIFGTHAPYQYAEAALLKMRESALSDQDQAAIFYTNAHRWMRPT